MINDVLVIGKIMSWQQISISDSIENLLNRSIEKHELSDTKWANCGMGLEVATGLAILGSFPILVSEVGQDYDLLFQDHFNDYNVQLKLFRRNDKFTATLIEISDEKGGKIRLNQDNAYKYLAENDLSSIMDLNLVNTLNGVFIATGRVEADVKFILDIFESNPKIPILYSPDGNINELTNWRIKQILEKISILICSEEELQKIESTLHLNRREILSSEQYSRLKYIISMEHRDRTIIHSYTKKIKISAGPADEVLSEVGWMNAFRAGLIHGVSSKKPIEEAAKLGSALASYAVETREFQPYFPSIEQVTLRSYEVQSVTKQLESI